MARRSIRERPDREEVLWPVQRACPACGHPMRLRYDNCRTLVALSGPVRLRLKIRRCEAVDCSRHHRPYRPEAEGAIALPEHEFGLDVIALVGTLRHREHRSVPEIHQTLRARDVAIAERSVTNLLSCPFSIGSHENSPPDFLFPVGGADAGMHGGGRVLSDG